MENEKRTEFIKKFVYDKENRLILGLLSIVVVIRLYYFFSLGEQPIWWDEGDYLAIAKVWANSMETPEWWSHFTGMRPLLMPAIFTGLFWLGVSELTVRFLVILLPSIGIVLLTYLIGKSLYNKNAGLVAATMAFGYWVISFYSYRLLTDIPSIFFGLLSVYFFVETYLKYGKPYGLYLCYLFGVVAFSIRFPLALVPITCFIYLIFVKRSSLIKDKTFLKSILYGILFLSPYLIYFIYSKFFLFRFYFGEEAVHQESITWSMIPDTLNWLHSFWAISFVIGIVLITYNLIVYLDIVLRQKSTKFNSDLFVFLFLFIHALFYMVIFKSYTERWILMMLPFVFIASGKGLDMIYNFLSKYEKNLALIAILILVVGGFYQNFSHSHTLIEDKKESYNEIKLAGLWLKENTPEDAKIITASVVQNQYYSERQSYDFFHNTSYLKSLDCIDKFGKTITNESCQSASERLFEEKLDLVNPDYLIVSVFEPVFTPEWIYTYPQRKNLTIVQAYAFKNQPQQAALIVYKL